MSESNQQQGRNPFTSGEAASWTKDQWNAYVASDEFIQHYTEKGVVDASKLAKTIGLRGYLMLMDHCPHLVVFEDIIIDADTHEGQEILGRALHGGELSLSVLTNAGILLGNKADDMIQSAITIGNICLQPGAIWDEDSYKEAMLWAPDQWRECMRYCDFKRNFVRGGIVQMSKLTKSEMPEELLDRMISRALNLVTVGDKVMDADTDAGVSLLENALADGRVGLARLIEAEVFTRAEAIQMHHDAVLFAEEHLHEEAKWAEEETKIVIPWIPEQWDAFVDTPQMDTFIDDGFVDVQRLKAVMGVEIFNIMISKVHILVETGTRVVTAVTTTGRKHLQEAVESGNVSLLTLVHAGVITQSDADKKIQEAVGIAQTCFKEGAEWDSVSEKDAMGWASDEWDAALSDIDFTKRFVKKGVVQRKSLIGIISNELYDLMAKRSTFLITIDHKVIDVRTAQGKELAESGLWNGDTPISTGIKLDLISRDQAGKLYEQAQAIAKANFQEEVVWSDEDRKIARKWSADQWEKALEMANFSALFTKGGIVDRDKVVVSMGPELFDVMVSRINAFVPIGTTVYDAFTKEGFNQLKELDAL